MEKYDNYKDSGIEWIGEIPEHWKVEKFKYLFFEHLQNSKIVFHSATIHFSII